MFGLFRKKKSSEEGVRFRALPEIRDCLRDITGEAMNVYVGTLTVRLLNLGKTSDDDVKRARTTMLAYLQKYVRRPRSSSTGRGTGARCRSRS